MARSPEALVEPALLVWARESARLSVDDAARKVPVKPERLVAWEEGTERPSISQLRKLAFAYKRPLAVFYLPEAPKDLYPPNDFRRLPGDALQQVSSPLQLEFRQAHERRAVALELYEETDLQLPLFNASASLDDNPEALGLQVRELFGITYEAQFELDSPYKALRHWRRALEEAGILVFQASGVELSEMRGFSISETPLPVVAVNTKDGPYGRVFTMLHETVHIMLRSSGICDLDNDSGRSPEEQRTEVFCNRVAGAALLPSEHLFAHPLVTAKGRDKAWAEKEIKGLAKLYSVSREVVLRRLLITGKTTEAFYKEKREQYHKEFESKPSSGGFVPYHEKMINAAGKPYIRLVLGAFHQEKITASDVADYLNVKLKHLDKIEESVSLG